ncbi:MAG: hypothetical protein IPO60_11135 [Flavobacteriales bacterium]|nr:hypothetical protein [Flavobacteriales bacterium]MBK9598847.1 hypothetical protein [Flavobacteriales bacterium]
MQVEREITTINRGFISILPKQPYYDWANTVFKDNSPMSAADKEATAYTISDDFAVKDLTLPQGLPSRRPCGPRKPQYLEDLLP